MTYINFGIAKIYLQPMYHIATEGEKVTLRCFSFILPDWHFNEIPVKNEKLIHGYHLLLINITKRNAAMYYYHGFIDDYGTFTARAIVKVHSKTLQSCWEY